MSLDTLAETLRKLARTRVLVGVPSDSEPHRGQASGGANARRDPTATAAPINNATLLYLHTNGVPELNVPARPVLEPTIREEREAIVARLRDAGRAAMEGRPDAIERNFHAIGLEVVSAARRRVQRGIPPPLSQRTVNQRRQRTRGSSYRRRATSASETTPLIDTGQLVAALSYVLRDR